MKYWLRVTICIVLIVSVFTMSLSVLAVDGSDTVKAKETLVAYYIWQFLHAIGIDVTFQDILEYNDYIQDTIIDWVMDYIADEIEADSMPSNYTIAQWIAPWQVGYDYWGNLQYNDTMLEDMEDFSKWLKAKFSLLDDDTIPVNPIYSVEGYNLYNFEQWYSAGNSTYMQMIADVTQNQPTGYWFPVFFYNDTTKPAFFVFISNVASYFQVTIKTSNDGLNENNFTSFNNGNPTYSPNSVGFYIKQVTYNGPYPLGGNYLIVEDFNEFRTWANTAVISMDGDVEIVTGTIIFPTDNPEYTPGDGITIVDGDPTYQEITFSGEITNLPAVVSTGTIENPHLEEAYRPIQGLINYAKDGVAVCTALLYELPDEMVFMWYGFIASIIIWGMIKLMREH